MLRSTFVFFLLFFISATAHAKVLKFSKDWVGFEIFGSYHLLADYSGMRSTTPSTVTVSSTQSQNFDAGANFFFFIYRYVLIRLGGMYYSPVALSFSESTTNAGGTAYSTATVTMYALGYHAGLDIVPYTTDNIRAYFGGLIGNFALCRATADIKYTTAGADDGNRDHVEIYKTANQLYYEFHAGVEFNTIDRLGLALELGYVIASMGGWTAGNDFTSHGRVVTSGSDVTFTGQSAKSERFGGFFGRLVIRSYF